MSEMGHGALYALAGAFSTGVMSLLARKGQEYSNAVTGAFISLFVSVPLFWAWALFAWTADWLNLKAIGLFLLAGFLGAGLGRTLLFFSIHRVGVTRTVPIIATTPLFTTTLAQLFLGEQPGPYGWAGTLLIVAGCVFLSLRKESDATWNPRALWIPFACVVGHAFSLLFRKLGMQAVPSPLMASAVASLAGLVSLCAVSRFLPASFLPDFGPRNAWYYFSVCGLLHFVGFLFMNYGLHFAGVSIAVPLNATAPLVSLLLAYFFLRDLERVTSYIVVGTISIVVGVCLIAWRIQ